MLWHDVFKALLQLMFSHIEEKLRHLVCALISVFCDSQHYTIVTTA